MLYSSFEGGRKMVLDKIKVLIEEEMNIPLKTLLRI